MAGSTLPNPLVVRLFDGSGRPVVGAAITFRFQGDIPNGEVTPASDRTDTTGLASARVRLGSTTGAQTVEALVTQPADPVLRATFDATALAHKNKGRDKSPGGNGSDDEEGDD